MAGGGGGKITKLLKKVQSLGKSNRRPTRTSSSSTNSSSCRSRSSSDDYYSSSTHSAYNNYHSGVEQYSGYGSSKTHGPTTVVYVGKSRRRYLLSSEVTAHPLFQEVVESETSCYDDDGDEVAAVVVGCEVVLFEHLLWMLQNADPQPESLDELADYYACS